MTLDQSIRQGIRTLYSGGSQESLLQPLRLMARAGLKIGSHVPWGLVKRYIHDGTFTDLRFLRHSLTFEQVCELTRHGYLQMSEFTTQDIIHLLEDSLIEEGQTPIVAMPRGHGDEQVRILERKYHQEPTKLNLLAYAHACLRYAVTPVVDFCLATPAIEPFFDPDRDVPK